MILFFVSGNAEISVKPFQRQAVISIKDTGVGISQKDLPNIFKRFYQCDRSRSQEGVGLGLSLARAIAQAHGGDITVASKPNMGSTFTVTLPASG